MYYWIINEFSLIIYIIFIRLHYIVSIYYYNNHYNTFIIVFIFQGN